MQTPAPFDYERATSVDGAIASLGRLGGEARIIAGGHSLLPMMKLRLATPAHLIDINDLERARPTSARRAASWRSARSPATSTCSSPSCSPSASRSFRDAEQVIADPVVRNRGTIGGSLCQADAAEDLSAVCAALKAQVVIRGAGGDADRRHGRVPPRAVDDRGRRRRDGDRGPAAAARRAPAARTRRSSGAPATGRSRPRRRRCGWTATRSPTPASALSAVGPVTIELTRAEELLRGATPSDELFAQAAEIAAGGLRADRRHARPGRLQAPPRGRAHQTCPAPRDGARAPAGGLNDAGDHHDQRRGGLARRRAAHAARALHPRHGGPDRHALGLRHVELRRLRRADGRQAAQVVHDAGRDVRGPRDPHRRVARGRRRARPGPAGLPRAARAAVRVLHAGDADDGRALLDENPDPTEQEIRTAISGAICRCTGYKNIVAAVRWAAEHEAATRQEA